MARRLHSRAVMSPNRPLLFLVPLLLLACDSEATTPNVVENVSYVTKVYENAPARTEAETPVVRTEAPVVVVDARPVGAGTIASCEAFFARTQTCARSLTSNRAALAHFEGQIAAARAAANSAAASGDPGLISQAAARCEASAAAYEVAPCGG